MSERKKLTQKEKGQVYQLFDGHCAYCGCKLDQDKMTADHVVPLRKGGDDALNNMFPACKSCNHMKSTYTVEQFRKVIERMPIVLMRDDTTYKNAVRFDMVLPNPHHVKFYFET